jgi:addiction module HigA family antidote
MSMKKAQPIKIGMAPTHPGTFVRDEILNDLDLNVTKAAMILGVRRATLSDFLNEHAGLTKEMALRIEKAFGMDMQTLLNMQAWHDAYTMRHRTNEIHVQRYRQREEA